MHGAVRELKQRKELVSKLKKGKGGQKRLAQLELKFQRKVGKGGDQKCLGRKRSEKLREFSLNNRDQRG